MKAEQLFKKREAGALVLSDGKVFRGEIFGKKTANMSNGALGEVVFNTAMTGYQEILTDPSYYGQIVIMTYPHIGNYGVNEEDLESKSVFVSGLVAHDFCDFPSSWRESSSIEEYFTKYNVPALMGVDTRALTRHLRDKGAMNAYIVSPAPTTKAEVDAVLQRLRAEPSFGNQDLVAKVSCKEAYEFAEKPSTKTLLWNWPVVKAKDSPLVAVLDLGVKTNMLRSLTARGCRVKVLPCKTTAEEIMKLAPKGVLLSNGPGDPACVEKVPDTVKALLGKVPVFGICMGHQILGHALGAKTYKMKFGHHGANQPVLDVKSKKVYITSQNHGYSIDDSTLPNFATVAQVNLNDQSVEGIELAEHKAFSVQYHPEACPGPRDSMGHFDEFMRLMGYD